MERSGTPANIPKNVEEAAGIFRVGEDAELAYRLQEQEYVDVQQFNENERRIVAHDIQLAKRVQSQEEDRALKMGYIPAYVKKEIAEKDFQIANQIQDQEVNRFVKLKQNERDGEEVAKELYEEEQKEFARRERELKEKERIAKRDREAAERIQKEEMEQFKAAEELAKMTARDAEYARKIALEEEQRMKNRRKNGPHGQDEEMAYKLSEAEKIKLKKLKESEAKDRHLAKVIMEQDFNKYNQKYVDRNSRRVDEEDLLAIQQIEIDRGNYNSTEGQYIAPRKMSHEKQPRPQGKSYSNHSKPPRSKHLPKNSKERSERDRRKDQKRPQNVNGGRKAENISKEFRSPRREYKAPAQYQSRPEAAVAYFPVEAANRRRDSDGGQSTESFGEFYNPKERSPMRRVKSLDSILDSESVCADGPGMTVRIKPGVYQKTPAVQLAEREAQRHKKHQKDVRREQRARQQMSQAQAKSRRAHPLPPRAQNSNQARQPGNVQRSQNPQPDVHQMLYGKAPGRKPKKKQSSDCSLM